MQSRNPPLPALTVKLSKYNVDDVALGVCKTGAEEAGVTEVRTSLSEKKFELWREINPNELNQDDARYGFRCCHLKNIWTAPLPPETELSRQMTTSTTSIDIMGLQAAYANLHTDQERDYFMQRYHDVISSFGGKTSYDADNRPLLVMRSNLWASGY